MSSGSASRHRPLHRVRDFARLVELSEYSIYRGIRLGQIKAVPVGNMFLIPDSERERLLAGEPLRQPDESR